MGGLFDEISKDGLSPEYLLSRDYLEDDPEGFINFCHKRLLFVDTMPNIVHDWIAKLERNQQSLGVITQISMVCTQTLEVNMLMNYMAR